jgi:hypothetical protein
MRELIGNLFGGFRFVRRWLGGKWAYVSVGWPVCDDIWLRLPDGAPPNYLEPLWEVTWEFEDYTT